MEKNANEYFERFSKNDHALIFKQYNRFIMHCITSFYDSIGRKCPDDVKEDIFQEIALKILKNGYIARFDSSKSSMTTWLGMIARTTAIDHLRRRRLELTGTETEPQAVTQDFDARFQRPLPYPDGVLTPRQTEVISLGFKEGLNSQEISARLGITPRTARSIKFQALERLRVHFGLPAHTGQHGRSVR